MKDYQSDLRRALKSIENYSNKNIKNWFKDFPKIASEQLHKLNTAPLQDPSVLAKIFSLKNWPRQQFPSGYFADLSFTLFRNDHFLLDLYVWNHQDTNIHDHHFSGAFKVVQGESFHIEYDFQKSKVITPWLEEGKLKIKEQSNLVAGDVKTILFKDNFIHQNMHTTNPCVTLCLRTLDHPKINLSSYYNLGMKILMTPISHNDQKMLEGLMYLCSIPNNESASQQFISKLSDRALYLSMTGTQPLLNRAPAAFHTIVHETLKKRDEHLFNWFTKVLKHQSKLNLQLATLFKTPS
jgi:hypothetical protein